MTVGSAHLTNMNRFGRQVQAVALMVEVEKVTSDRKSLSLADLNRMDEKLQEFLTVLMSESLHGHQCGSNRAVIRLALLNCKRIFSH